MPLCMAELAKAATNLPIGFIEQEDSFTAVAVTSIQPEKNFFIAADGRWCHGYIPAAIRSYPFRLANTNDGQKVLCIDEDSGLIQDGLEGELFFDNQGKPAPAIIDIMNFLTQLEKSREVTAAACAMLKKHNLIKPWPITVKGDSGKREIKGLFQIDETALNQLSADALFEVRNSGGLLIAYCQMISMQHLPILSELAAAHAKVAAQTPNEPPAGEKLNREKINQSEPLDFSSFL